MTASQARRHVGLLGPGLARRGRRPRDHRVPHREARRARAKNAAPDESELEEHLVVGLLRDERAGRRPGSSAVGWSGKRARASGMYRAYSSGGSSPYQPGAEDRVVEEDAAADVDVDQPLAPARRVLARACSGWWPEPGLEKAELAAAKRHSPGCHRCADSTARL